MGNAPKPNSGTWVWYLGAIAIFLLGGVTFAADGHWAYAALAFVGVVFCAGFLAARSRV
jgi:hypothetical protein